MEKKVEDLELEKSDLQKTIEKLNGKLDEKREKITELNENLLEKEEEFEEYKEKTEDQIEDLENTIDEKDDELDILRKFIRDDLPKLLDTINGGLGETEDEVKKLYEQVLELYIINLTLFFHPVFHDNFAILLMPLIIFTMTRHIAIVIMKELEFFIFEETLTINSGLFSLRLF